MTPSAPTTAAPTTAAPPDTADPTDTADRARRRDLRRMKLLATALLAVAALGYALTLRREGWLGFVNAAVARTGHKRNPFHPFSVFDTVTLAGIAYGQTVLARAATAAGLGWDANEAHSAVYDTEQTARLFCTIANARPR